MSFSASPPLKRSRYFAEKRRWLRCRRGFDAMLASQIIALAVSCLKATARMAAIIHIGHSVVVMLMIRPSI
jgi:hypothetical protein